MDDRVQRQHLSQPPVPNSPLAMVVPPSHVIFVDSPPTHHLPQLPTEIVLQICGYITDRKAIKSMSLASKCFRSCSITTLWSSIKIDARMKGQRRGFSFFCSTGFCLFVKTLNLTTPRWLTEKPQDGNLELPMRKKYAAFVGTKFPNVEHLLVDIPYFNTLELKRKKIVSLTTRMYHVERPHHLDVGLRAECEEVDQRAQDSGQSQGSSDPLLLGGGSQLNLMIDCRDYVYTSPLVDHYIDQKYITSSRKYELQSMTFSARSEMTWDLCGPSTMRPKAVIYKVFDMPYPKKMNLTCLGNALDNILERLGPCLEKLILLNQNLASELDHFNNAIYWLRRSAFWKFPKLMDLCLTHYSVPGLDSADTETGVQTLPASLITLQIHCCDSWLSSAESELRNTTLDELARLARSKPKLTPLLERIILWLPTMQGGAWYSDEWRGRLMNLREKLGDGKIILEICTAQRFVDTPMGWKGAIE